jgi:hypothetical protein
MTTEFTLWLGLRLWSHPLFLLVLFFCFVFTMVMAFLNEVIPSPKDLPREGSFLGPKMKRNHHDDHHFWQTELTKHHWPPGPHAKQARQKNASRYAHYKHELDWQCENFQSLRRTTSSFPWRPSFAASPSAFFLSDFFLDFFLLSDAAGLFCSWLVFGQRCEGQAKGHHGGEQQG